MWKTIKLPQYIDTERYDAENYDGQIVCQECKSLLYVKSVKGKVQKSKVVKKFEPAGKPSKLEIVIVRNKEAEQQPREEGNIVKDTGDRVT